MDAEVAVRRLKQALQIVEGQAVVHRQRTDDAEAQPLVNEPVEGEGTLRLGLVAGGWWLVTPDCRLPTPDY
jgi:hypothetical protein